VLIFNACINALITHH